MIRNLEGATVSAELLVIIPAWNEEEAISGALEAVAAALPNADVVVIDDGSTDQTCQRVLESPVDVTLIREPFNMGVGGAMRLGYLYSARNNYRYTCQVDADGQHDPSFIPSMIEALEAQGADIVVGSRFAGVGKYSAKGPRRWAMSLLSRWLSRICNAKLTDTTSGFKLTNAHATNVLSKLMPAEYLGDTLDSLVILAKHGCTITETGVQMRERQGGTPSHSPFSSGIFLFRAFLSVALSVTRKAVPSSAKES